MNTLNLPNEIKDIIELAKNYWWSWNQESYELFSAFDEQTWKQTRTPLVTIKAALDKIPKIGETLAADKNFVSKLTTLKSELDAYMKAETHPKYKVPSEINGQIAYFCAEYGIHESLPIYSGGLGVLAGDHVKSASDLALPLLFVGLFYKNGYFTQQINAEGQQEDHYQIFAPELLGLESAKDPSGKEVIIEVNLAGRKVKARVWKAQVGRSALYLLDSDVEGNTQADREITARLYGGDREMRISQEIILGIGGVKALEAMDIHPGAYHMNEGHSGFFQLERIKNEMKKRSINFEEARLLVSTNCLFTTHTPVPAGNEAFSLPLMHKYFHDYIRELDISWHRFIALGLVDEKTDYKYFSLTVFAINVSRFYNGVSELHGEIAKRMWSGLWKNVPAIDNPISSITNGVHTQTWMAKETKSLLGECFGNDWKAELIDQKYWERVREISTDKIVQMKRDLKEQMIGLVRERQVAQYERFGQNDHAKEAVNFLRDDVLTIGFARRFATYKRATLIFKDLKRLSKIVNNEKRPVQFIFAGKAHPQDVPGQEYIKEIHRISQMDEFRGKVIMLEGYDMNISSKMVAGVDVWLNNSRRPMEASGTSGQKVPINFGLNFSVLDGWWREGHNGDNGWTIGDERDYPSDQVQDFEDANDFYATLEDTISTLYYDNHEGWVEKCKNSFISTVHIYGTDRMVSDYASKFYKEAFKYHAGFNKDGKQINNYLETRRFLARNWSCLTVTGFSYGDNAIEVGVKNEKYVSSPHHHVDFNVDDTIPGRSFEASSTDGFIEVYLGDMTPKNVACELVITDREKNTLNTQAITLNEMNDKGLFRGEFNFTSDDKDPKVLRLRLFPTLAGLQNKFELGQCTWI